MENFIKANREKIQGIRKDEDGVTIFLPLEEKFFKGADIEQAKKIMKGETLIGSRHESKAESKKEKESFFTKKDEPKETE